MLKSLLEHGEQVCGIICVPERFKDKTSGYDDLSDLADEYGIPLHKSRRLHTQKCLEFIKGLRPDLMVVYGWQRIIKPEVLSLPMKSIGFHASLLPKYRGSAPVNWAIIRGETETGVTMFELSEGVDAGPIYSQKAFPINFHDTCATVYEKSAKAACQLILEKLPEWKQGKFETTPNPSSDYPIMPRRRPEDGEIQIPGRVREMHDFIRALTKPYPGAFIKIGHEKWVLWEAQPIDNEYLNELSTSFLSMKTPMMLDVNRNKLVLKCLDGYLVVTRFERKYANY